MDNLPKGNYNYKFRYTVNGLVYVFNTEGLNIVGVYKPLVLPYY